MSRNIKSKKDIEFLFIMTVVQNIFFLNFSVNNVVLKSLNDIKYISISMVDNFLLIFIVR